MKRREGIGPVGRRVAANLRKLRTDRRLTTSQLADILRELGQPILATGITKTEAASRRVDVDDLMALAIALRVSPNRLLLTDKAEGQIELAPDLTVHASDAWEWARGKRQPQPTPAEASSPTTAEEQVRDDASGA